MATQTNSTASIVVVPFQGDTLIAIRREDGIYVAIRPICERLGIDWSAQYRRILRTPVLSEAVAMAATPFTRHGQEETCLKLDYLNGWLMGIDAKRVNPEARDGLIAYQRECHRVLFEHFYRKTIGAAPGGQSRADLAARRARVNEMHAATRMLDVIRRSSGNRIAARAAPGIFATIGIVIDLTGSDTLAQGELPFAEAAEAVH